MEIYKSNPKRREPGDGSDGTCDCICLPIGAIRRMGLKWPGIHGSNWAARQELQTLKEIKSQNELEPGDLVLKAVPQGHKNWTLNKYPRYLPGGKYYNGDLNDYYHAGVVESVNPLRIRHMSNKMKTDTTVKVSNPWTHYGKLNILIKAAGGVTPTPDPYTPSAGTQAMVVASSGKTVNLRRKPSKITGTLVARVPLLSKVDVLDPGDEWCYVQYGNKKGYMMAKFLDIIGDGKGDY
jgi:hypothetical protein